jgi:hypothetical protein
MPNSHFCSVFINFLKKSKDFIVMILDVESEDNAEVSISLLWDSIAFIKEPSKSIVIRVFIGGNGAPQIICFKAALDRLRLQENIQLEYINTEDVRKNFQSPSKLVEWLLGAHVHFVLAHVHQGISQLEWNMDELATQLKRLKFHRGFPNGKYLGCPIFTQNKFKYIKALGNFANPTIPIDLNDDDPQYFSSISNKIKRFYVLF